MLTGRHRKREWCALMIDVSPEEFAAGKGGGEHGSAWARIPGEHDNRDAA
jgi:hypothetical protein